MRNGPKCRRVEPLLARAAGGDLSPARARSLEDHARACARCREAAEAFATTMHTVRELPALELSPEEGAELRRGVWAAIERERTRFAIRRNGAAWIAGGWAAAALVLLAILLSWRAIRNDRPATTAALPPSPPALAAPAERHDAPAAAAPSREPAPRMAGRRTHLRAHPIPESEPTQPVRIELSTSDPDLRIWWLSGPPAEARPPRSAAFATDDATDISPDAVKEDSK